MRWPALFVICAACSFHGAGAGSGDDDVAPPRDATDAPGDGAAVACDIGATWADGATPARDVHVSTTANGAPDGTAEHPYPTITAAMPMIAPGVRVVVDAGTYAGETLVDLHGTRTAPIWIEGPAAAPRAVFTGGGPGIHLIRPQYVVLRHLDVTTVSQSGINADDGGDRANPVAHHVVIDDVAVSSANPSCFQLTGVTDAVVTRSRATSCGRGVFLIGVHRAVIARIEISTTSTAGFAVAGGSDDIELRQSVLANATTRSVWIGGDSAATEFRPPLASATGNYEASQVRVFDNVIQGGGSTIGVLCSGCTDSLVAHNLILGAAFTHVFQLLQEHGALGTFDFVPAGKVRYLANAIEVGSNPFGARGGPGTDAPSCTFARNLWYETDNPANSTPNLPSPETGGVYGVPSGYDNAWRLCGGGASIGKAAPVPEVPGTREGSCRPAPPSIGPGERDPSC